MLFKSLDLTFLDATRLLATAILALVVLRITINYVRVLRLRRKLPPGPFPWPVFGNYFGIPKVKPWIKWEKLAFKYEYPLTTIWNGSRPVIVCNDAWSISDLFEKRASIYSSRPRMVMMGDSLNTSDSNQVCLKYNDQWRLHRRLTHSVVGSQAVRAYRGFQGDETKILLRDLMTTADDFVMAIERYSCSIASIVGWGRRIDKINDYVAQKALELMGGVDLIIPGNQIMETLPFLFDLPWFINPIPAAILKVSNPLRRFFFRLSKEAYEAGSADCFARRLFEDQHANKLTEAEIANLTGNLIGGGVDTTSSTMISFVLAMCCFPEKQKKAQEELDRIVGQDRMPSWEDDLPYIKACVEEVLRWRTVTILGGIPHAPTQDDIYDGYLIPKDTWVVGNVWAIHRNPGDYPEPDQFRPERFLNGLERPYPNKKGHNAFGWGRRQCSGQPLAEQGLASIVARLLWAFDIKPGLDNQGHEVKLDIFAYTESENMRPEPFKARFIPRTSGIEWVINKEAEAARESLRQYDGETKLKVEPV